MTVTLEIWRFWFDGLLVRIFSVVEITSAVSVPSFVEQLFRPFDMKID